MAPGYIPCYNDDECPEFHWCDTLGNVCAQDAKHGETIASSMQPTIKFEQTIASTTQVATIVDSTSSVSDIDVEEDSFKKWIIIYTLAAFCALLIILGIVIQLKPLVIKMLRKQRQAPLNADKLDIEQEETNPLKNAEQPSVDQESSALPKVKVVTSARERSRYHSGTGPMQPVNDQ